MVTMRDLLECGVHFGHQVRRWNPKMKKFIFGERKGIYIIDLQKTIRYFRYTYNIVRDAAAEGKTILFVGTKKQAGPTVGDFAKECGMPYVNHRWLGGMLTNFATIRQSIRKLEVIEKMEEDGTFDVLPKKEVIQLKHEREKLEKFLGGIKKMNRLPDLLFVVDPKKEKIAVKEAHILGIPVVGIVDTNCDPDELDFVIPGNDDAIRAVKLITETIANAVLEVRQGVQMSDSEDKTEESAASAE